MSELNILVIDGQGGGLGKQIISRLKDMEGISITAVGTNSTATAAMMKGGAKRGATGENSVIVACRNADVIIGAIGIIGADSLLGEITPEMAVAIGRSAAVKILIPMNMCDIVVPGCDKRATASYLDDMADMVSQLAEKK